jgi:hypothetical protein
MRAVDNKDNNQNDEKIKHLSEAGWVYRLTGNPRHTVFTEPRRPRKAGTTSKTVSRYPPPWSFPGEFALAKPTVVK